MSCRFGWLLVLSFVIMEILESVLMLELLYLDRVLIKLLLRIRKFYLNLHSVVSVQYYNPYLIGFNAS